MYPTHDRALKEWAFVCESLRDGTQIVLIRKGGIREDDGVFRVKDPEFFLLPTYEHQDAGLLQPRHAERLAQGAAVAHDPRSVRIDTYAEVDAVTTVADEDALYGLCGEYVWNERYIRQRLDYSPYDPLYVILLRVYRLPEAAALPMREDYEGCKSWVTLERPLSTVGAVPVLSAAEYARRRQAVLGRLGGGV